MKELKELKYRNEFKHVINKAQAIVLKSKLKAVMQSDPYANENGEYFIRSLYFDTPDDKALSEKLAGVPFREKYRIRFYNLDASKIRLEDKMKRFSSCCKIGCDITREEVEKILAGDYAFLKESKEPLKAKFFLELESGAMRSKTLVDYTRTPFICKLGNVRVTIDSDIRAPSSNLFDMFDKSSPTVSVFPDERSVLEIKYDEYIPEYIHKLVQISETRTNALSKYAACRKFV